ncbi:hypothetical protein F444_17987 [Phytophthora nicotianae P1976]|uniref:HTH CENPB-type domain-containing protein n=1 Tax=Phytophthora nicotianae P1976 TaxID=1317066 RepID=A0A080ZCS1_PHYNI|nr:hypothetical protein F444_17987 [Phytophthora nicotianae P1976]
MAEVSTYLLLVLRGLEFLVEEEIRSKLQVESLEICSVQENPSPPYMQVMQGQAAVGRIILQTKSSAAEVQELRSVQATLALLAKSGEIDTESDAGVKQIGQLVQNADWDSAVKLWKQHSVRPVEDSEIKFRGSCVRDGKHKYNSQVIAGEVGARVVEKFGWAVNLTEFDLEVVVIIFYKFMVAGIALADPRKIQFRNRLANESRSALADSDYISTLRPSTAYLMLQLAQHKYGDVVLDSMCGIGTLPICSADFTNDGVYALGGELDELPSGKAGQNAVTRPRPVDIARWDSTRLPLRSHSVDRVMIDMPFGVRCGNQRQNNKMYPKVFKELLRVLRPDGRAVLLVMSKKLFKGVVKDLPVRVVAEHMVSIGGLGGGIYVIEPATAAPSQPTEVKPSTIGQKRSASSNSMSTMVGKGRGKRLTDSERMEIIARLEDPSSQLSKAECARQHGVTPAAISKLMKVSQSVKKRYSDAGADSGGFRDKRQRGGFSKNVPFEDELFRWICSVRARKVPLLVSHVQSKAKILATRHKMKEDFKASNGWYYRFCNRYGLTPASLHAGNSTSSGVETQQSSTGDMKKEGAETTHEWTNLRDKIKQFGPEFVYTLSEARLFYQMLPRALDVMPEHTGTGQETAGMIANAVERNGASGKAARVLVLMCVNATGTHKIPLLIVGKEKAPACLAAIHPQLLRGDINSSVGISASYYSQRDIWCSDRTFKHWCERVFLPAVRQRTTQPVLLITENPGGRLAAFQQENVSTVFLPLRTNSGGGDISLSTQQHSLPANGNTFQPPHAAVIRDLKHRYKIGLFQERLNFIETPDDEKYRLIQRAAKKPLGTAGVALGRVPNLIDAMSLLDEAWAAIPPSLIRHGWIKANLGNNSILSPESMIREQNDDAVVMECCSMLRNLNLVDDMNKLAKDIRLWLCVDDDSSEQMQQELLYDLQQLLQEEEQQQQQGRDQNLHQPASQMAFQQNSTAFMDAGLSTSFDPSQTGSYVYRTADGRAASAPTMDPNVVQEEKRKAIVLALHTLAGAEETLDNADVAEYFGDEAAGQAMESISRALRRLRRIQRGKQSALVAAAVNAAANGDANDSTGGALSTHEYFYGNGALGRNV